MSYPKVSSRHCIKKSVELQREKMFSQTANLISIFISKLTDYNPFRYYFFTEWFNWSKFLLIKKFVSHNEEIISISSYYENLWIKNSITTFGLNFYKFYSTDNNLFFYFIASGENG